MLLCSILFCTNKILSPRVLIFLCGLADGRRAAAFLDKRQGISGDVFLFCELFNQLFNPGHTTSVKVKVKFTPEQATKAQKGVGV